MDLDLGRALHDAARSGTAHRPAIDAVPVLRRIRRRRTVRHAVEGTVGAAALGAVAFGAVQVADLRDPLPVAPASPTPAPSPPPSPTPPPTPSPTPTPTPTPTPSLTPEAPVVEPHPDLDELVLSPSGLGPLAVGVPPAGNPGAAMIELDATRCEGFDDGSAARWVAAGYPDEVVDGQPRDAFFVAASDEAVGRIDVLGSTPRTAEGIGVGSTLVELQAAYPQLEGPHDGPVSRVWWLSGPTGTLVFETQGDADGLRPAGTPESIILVRVLAAGVDPAFATANSGDLAGTCL